MIKIVHIFKYCLKIFYNLIYNFYTYLVVRRNIDVHTTIKKLFIKNKFLTQIHKSLYIKNFSIKETIILKLQIFEFNFLILIY